MRNKRKFLIVFGTRPEAIKLIPLIRQLKKSEDVKLYLCSSGQHREMLDGVLEEYGIAPDFDLALMKDGQSLSSLCSAMIGALEGVIKELCPELVIVHGDTTTSLCGALAAFYCGVAVAHVEAGLRSGDIRSPFPEEFNRRTISSITSVHFAPTEAARQNLLSEGVAKDSIFVVGNTATDMLADTKTQSRRSRFPCRRAALRSSRFTAESTARASFWAFYRLFASFRQRSDSFCRCTKVRVSESRSKPHFRAVSLSLYASRLRFASFIFLCANAI